MPADQHQNLTSADLASIDQTLQSALKQFVPGSCLSNLLRMYAAVEGQLAPDQVVDGEGVNRQARPLE